MTVYPTKPHPGVLWADGDRPLFELAQALRTRVPGLKHADALVFAVLTLDIYKSSTSRGTKAAGEWLAQWTGLDRTTVSDSLTRLKAAGVVRRRGATGPLVIGRLPTAHARALSWHRSSVGYLSRVSALPSNWTNTTERLMLILSAAAADPVGRYAIPAEVMPHLVSATRNTARDNRKSLRSWDGERPPLIEAEGPPNGPRTTPYRLCLPVVPFGRDDEPLDTFAREWASAELIRDADSLADAVDTIDVLDTPAWLPTGAPATGAIREHQPPPATGAVTGAVTGATTGAIREHEPGRFENTTLYYPPPCPHPARIRTRGPAELTTPLAVLPIDVS